MGDRVLVAFTDDDGTSYSPAVYMHWGGSDAADMIKAAVPHMRRGDALYAAARFCGECHKQLPGVTGLGLMAGPDAGADWDEYSHGDAGVYLVDVNTGKVDARGGYGEPFQLDPEKFGSG